MEIGWGLQPPFLLGGKRSGKQYRRHSTGW